MKYQVLLTHEAEQQLLEIARWWSEHRDPEQANRWLKGFDLAIQNLANNAEMQPLARESQQFYYPLHNLLYGLSRRKTHRAVFRIRNGVVEILAVRHLAQRDLRPDEIG